MTTDNLIRLETIPRADQLHAIVGDEMDNHNRRATVVYRTSRVEFEIDYDAERVTAYVVDPDGQVYPDDEITTVNFDKSLNLDTQGESAVAAAAADVVEFWKAGT